MPQPMTIGLLGSGEMKVEAAISLIEDLAEVADPVTVIVAADEKNWTPTLSGITEFLADNDVAFELVIDDGSDVPAEVTEAAQSTHKVARPAQKVVALLERAEGDKRLVVLWDDENEDAVKATERAVDRGIKALDLTAGLEELTFDGDADEPGVEPAVGATEADEADEANEQATEVVDDGLDKLGVRALRNLVEEEAGLSRKVVGSMDKGACIAALRDHRAAGTAPADAEDEVEDEADEATEEATAPAAEADPDEAQQSTVAVPSNASSGGAVSATMGMAADDYLDRQARQEALFRACDFHTAETDVDTVVRTAHRFKAFLTGEQVVAGRPRRDGSPAQPRIRSAG